MEPGPVDVVRGFVCSPGLWVCAGVVGIARAWVDPGAVNGSGGY